MTGTQGRLTPFLLAALLSALTLAVPPWPQRPASLLGACLVMILVLLSLRLPWRRWVPRWQVAPPLGFLGVVVLVQDAFDGAGSGFASLALLPVAWLALYGTRRQVLMAVAGLTMSLSLPMLLCGRTALTGDWRSAVVWTLVAGAVGIAVRRKLEATAAHDTAAHRAAVVDGRLGTAVLDRGSELSGLDSLSSLRGEQVFSTAALDTVPCLVLVLTPDGVVLHVNPAVEQLTGHPVADLVGRPPWDSLLTEQERPHARARFAGLRAGSVPAQHEEDWVIRDGQRRRIVVTNACLRDSSDTITHVVKTGVDVTELRGAIGLVTQVLAAASTVAVIATGPDGIITVFNSGAENLLGYRADDVIGRHDPGLFHDPDEVAQAAARRGIPPGFEVFVADLEHSEEPVTQDWTYICKDGTRRTVALTVSAMVDAFGARTGYLGVAQDVSQLRQAEADTGTTLKAQADLVRQLRDLDQAKTSFLAAVSHELRTPITNIIGYTDMIADGEAGVVTGQQQHALEVTSRNSQRLLNLIEDLLAVSRIESGQFHVLSARLNLCDVIAGVRLAMPQLLHGRRLNVTVEVPAHPVIVLGDAELLQRALRNVIGNAVKFTPDGGHVRCRLEVAAGHADLIVSDDGVGIADQEQDKIFTEFFRSVTATKSAKQGTGLGLAIVKAVMDGHDGVVAVTSTEGAGTTVTLSLPLVPSTAPVQTATGHAGPRPTSAH